MEDLKGGFEGWISNVYVPALWSSNLTQQGMVVVDPILVKTSTRDERSGTDNQRFELDPKPCFTNYTLRCITQPRKVRDAQQEADNYNQQTSGPPGDPERWQISNDGAQPGSYALLAWRDRFFEKAVKTVSADGSPLFTVPHYNPQMLQRYSDLSNVRLWIITTAEQAMKFFDVAKHDGLLATRWKA
eukprot:750480-Hanusia_phi.AAC.13